jgi:putative endopeptidase
MTNPHSPGKYRINGIVADLPQFARVFSCKAGAPMVSERPCRVW